MKRCPLCLETTLKPVSLRRTSTASTRSDSDVGSDCEGAGPASSINAGVFVDVAAGLPQGFPAHTTSDSGTTARESSGRRRRRRPSGSIPSMMFASWRRRLHASDPSADSDTGAVAMKIPVVTLEESGDRLLAASHSPTSVVSWVLHLVERRNTGKQEVVGGRNTVGRQRWRASLSRGSDPSVVREVRKQ